MKIVTINKTIGEDKYKFNIGIKELRKMTEKERDNIFNVCEFEIICNGESVTRESIIFGFDRVNKIFDFDNIWNFDYDKGWAIINKLGASKLKLSDKEFNELENVLYEYQEYHRNKLPDVIFKEYNSWETGLDFWVLSKNSREINKNVFNELKEKGLYFHKYDEECEERFTGWTFSLGSYDEIKETLENHHISSNL